MSLWLFWRVIFHWEPWAKGWNPDILAGQKLQLGQTRCLSCVLHCSCHKAVFYCAPGMTEKCKNHQDNLSETWTGFSTKPKKLNCHHHPLPHFKELSGEYRIFLSKHEIIILQHEHSCCLVFKFYLGVQHLCLLDFLWRDNWTPCRGWRSFLTMDWYFCIIYCLEQVIIWYILAYI